MTHSYKYTHQCWK